MKLNKLFLFLTIVLLPLTVNAEVCDLDKIIISSISLEEKADSVEEVSEATITKNNINLNVSMTSVGDNIKYKMIIKNLSSNDYILAKNKVSSNYIDYDILTIDGSNIIKANSNTQVYFIAKYTHMISEEQFESGKYNDNKLITIQLSDRNTNKLSNPNTRANLFILLIVFLIICSILIYGLLLKKKYKKMSSVIIFALMLIPLSVYALCDFEINIESNISITKDKEKKATDIINNLVSNADSTNTEVHTAEKVSDSCDNTLAYDGTYDNNLRYVGSNPCNYVMFNDEIWRIIGVMNNVDDGMGKKETRIKIVRGEPLDNYSWDRYLGPNDWSKTPIMSQLNNNYFNEGINNSAKNMIADAVWHLGGAANSSYNADTFYQLERGKSVWGTLPGQACDDSACPRSTEWTGKIAFMYPSDYGFSVGERECLNNTLGQYASYCKFMSWFKIGELFITPTNKYYNYIFSIENSGYGEGNIVYYYVYQSSRISPSLFLKADVKIDSGNGSQESPFVLSLE